MRGRIVLIGGSETEGHAGCGKGGLSFRVVRGCRRVDQAGVGLMRLSHRVICETNIALRYLIGC